MAEDSETMITLVSMESKKFEVPRKVAQMSQLCSTMLEGSEDEAVEVPLPNVKSEILTKVIEFCTHHVSAPMAEIDKPLKSANMNENVTDPWDGKAIRVSRKICLSTFVDTPQDVIFELILAANYMDIKSLLDLTCAKVASLIKGKSPEDIRRTFNIVNDFTPEEEAQVREENKWCEDA